MNATVQCKLFSSSTKKWDQLVAEAAEFATGVGRDTDQIEKTVMLPLCYRNPDREGFVQGLIANLRQTTPELARKQIMIGDKAECLGTIERYRKVGVTHFIFMTFAPYQLDELQGFAEEVIPAAR